MTERMVGERVARGRGEAPHMRKEVREGGEGRRGGKEGMNGGNEMREEGNEMREGEEGRR